MLHLVFVGPEISEIDDGAQVAPPSPRLSAECVRGTLGALLAERPQLTAANTVCVGFNTGMGSGLYPLMQSWLRGSMGQSAPLGSARARLLHACLLGARLVALGGSEARRERDRATVRPAIASGARASRPQSR